MSSREENNGKTPWSVQILADCLAECDGDVNAAIAATSLILTAQPEPTPPAAALSQTRERSRAPTGEPVTLNGKTYRPGEFVPHDEAHEASGQAYDLGHTAIRSGDPKHHAEAATAHREASKVHAVAAQYSKVKKRLRNRHERMAKAHERAALKHDASAKPAKPKHITHTPEFKSWFGDWEKDPSNASKVVNGSREPQETHGTAKKVFHGTTINFSKFDKSKSRGGNVGHGFYFAENPELAFNFADDTFDSEDHSEEDIAGGRVGGNIIPAYLNVRKPFNFDATISLDEVKKWSGAESVVDKLRKNTEDNSTTGYDLWYALVDHLNEGNNTYSPVGRDKVNDYLSNVGYDGIVHRDGDSAGSPARPRDEALDGLGRVWIVFEPAQIKSIHNVGSFDLKNEEIYLNISLSHDIHNPQAQGVLDRALRVARKISAAARRDLAAVIAEPPGRVNAAVLKFLEKYRDKLASLLTSTQVAAVLEGIREVAAKVPTLAQFPGAIPPPPTLEPADAVVLVERLEGLPVAEQAEAIYELAPAEQVYVRQAIAARAAPPPAAPPVLPQGGGGDPEDVHFPTIDRAVRHLAERSVMDRQQYDKLDAAARSKAFTVASVSSEETLTKIRDSLARNVREGADYGAWRKKVLADVDAGTFLSDAHQETVFRTNVQAAFSDGQASLLEHPLVRGGFPYAAYDAIHDDRVRENHLALEELGIDGTNIYRLDDPVFQTFRPPWDYSDRCGWTPLTVRQAARRGVGEAKRWLEEGVEPSPPTHVPMPDFQPPEGFRRAVAAAPLSVQLSLQPMVAFAFDSSEKRDKKGKWAKDETTTKEGTQKILAEFEKKVATFSAEKVEKNTMGSCESFAAHLSNYLDSLNIKNTLVHVVGKSQTNKEIDEETGGIHVLVKVGDNYLDVTGVKSKEEVLKEWEGAGKTVSDSKYTGEEIRPLSKATSTHSKKWSYRKDLQYLFPVTPDEEVVKYYESRGAFAHDVEGQKRDEGGKWTKQEATDAAHELTTKAADLNRKLVLHSSWLHNAEEASKIAKEKSDLGLQPAAFHMRAAREHRDQAKRLYNPSKHTIKHATKQLGSTTPDEVIHRQTREAHLEAAKIHTLAAKLHKSEESSNSEQDDNHPVLQKLKDASSAANTASKELATLLSDYLIPGHTYNISPTYDKGPGPSLEAAEKYSAEAESKASRNLSATYEHGEALDNYNKAGDFIEKDLEKGYHQDETKKAAKKLLNLVMRTIRQHERAYERHYALDKLENSGDVDRRAPESLPEKLDLNLSLEWVTIGGVSAAFGPDTIYRGKTPPSDNWVRISDGPRGGTRWAKVGSPPAEEHGVGKRGNKVKGGGHGGRRGSDGQGGGRADGEPQAAGSGVAAAPGGPGVPTAGKAGKGAGKPAGDQAPRGVPRTDIGRVNQRIARYAEVFKKRGNDKLASVMQELRDQIATVGAKAALEVLGEAERAIELPTGVVEPEQGTPAAEIVVKIEATKSASDRAAIIAGLPPDQQDYIRRVVISKAHKVQYEGAYDELWYNKVEDQFVRKYLEKTGIVLLQSGSTYDPKIPLVSSFSEKNLAALKREGRVSGGENYVPTDQTLANKLEESKLLPGLETSEDVDTVVGDKVTAFTPEVVAAFDRKYGRGKWLVKSYGAEAYAGFGVVFPQRAKQVQDDAKFTLKDAKDNLKDRGYKLSVDSDGIVNGVVGNGKTHLLGTPEFDALDKVTKRYGKQAQQASFSAGGMRLPMSPEDSIRSNYQTSLLRDAQGTPVGITYWDGRDYKFNTPAYDKIASLEGGALGADVARAVEADEWRRQGFQTDPKFMVQPAFKAVGVTDADRAAGATWETAKEGRVHVVTRGGKASAIPYATMTGRGDALPAAIRSPDIMAMEKAVEDAIHRLPESERTGQMYAPDVMKTDKGWKVLELNPSAEGGGSDWLGQNPFVIDAFVSHMTGGRDPQHVKFIRKLLKDSGVKLKKQQTAALPAESPTSGQAQPTVKGGAPMSHEEQLRDDSGKWTSGINKSKSPLDDPDVAKFIDYLEKVEDATTPAEKEIGNAITLENSTRLYIKKDEKLVGALAYRMDVDIAEIVHLGSTEKGIGSKLLKELMASNNKVRANFVTKEAIKFYEKHGFKWKNEEDMVWEGGDTKSLSTNDQPREPAGTPGGGRFASAGRLGSVRTVKYGSLTATYTTHGSSRIVSPKLPLRNYKQRDDHSCGFVAALALARYFTPDVAARDVLRVVRPTKSGGIDARRLTDALAKLGVSAEYTDKLTVGKLRKHVADGTPVLITVYPEGWSTDHWTVVQAVSDERVYLTNYKSLSIAEFNREWFDRGEGLVCSRSSKSASLSTEVHRDQSEGDRSEWKHSGTKLTKRPSGRHEFTAKDNNKYTLHHHEDSRDGRTSIYVHDRSGEQVAKLKLEKDPTYNNKSYYVDHVRTEGTHRGLGIARAMYDYATEVHGKKIRKSPAHTMFPEGNKLWEHAQPKSKLLSLIDELSLTEEDILLAMGLPFPRPKGWYRSPNAPKPGWVNVYTTPTGAKWWASPKNAATGIPSSSVGSQPHNTMTPAQATAAGFAANPNHLGVDGATADPTLVTEWHQAGWFWNGTTWVSSKSKKAPKSTSGAAGTSAKAPANTPDEKWETGVVRPGALHGIPFGTAPHKFWEKVADVDVNEPKPLKPVQRVGILIQEPDGRVWIVKPTNEFGNRKHTLPGGRVEPGLTNQQNALKETWEETGIQCEITGYVGDFEDSNNKNNGRLYIGKRVGGAPWDAKIESHITSNKTGKAAAESEEVMLVTPERAAKLLHRTDDLAQIIAVNPIPLKHPVKGAGSNPLKKFLNGIAPAVKAIVDKKKAAGLKTGNVDLSVVQDMRGFNEKPTVIAKTDFDDLIGKGKHVELLRGLTDTYTSSYTAKTTAATLADEFRYGDHFPGFGIYGSGTYADSKSGSKNVATQYSSFGNGAMLRMALPKTAKVVKASELRETIKDIPDEFAGYLGAGGKEPLKCWRGVQAALAGYDAVYVDKKGSYCSHEVGYYVILNRSILTVQKEDATGHQIP